MTKQSITVQTTDRKRKRLKADITMHNP